MALITAGIIGEMWMQAMRNCPWPQGDAFYAMLSGQPQPSYRQRLDRQPLNFWGEPIPRIEIVRHHLAMLGPRRLDPRRLV